LTVPPGLAVVERGWLSSNMILFAGGAAPAIVDSGYATHSDLTLSLVRDAFGPLAPRLLLNTHLHSDHCGGNAALQAAFPGLRTMIPPGQARDVRRWDPVALTYVPTGQTCPRFGFDDVLRPGAIVQLGDTAWQVHAAPGHDPHSVVLFEPASGTLISADALWENGFGVVFPELEGENAFSEVAETLSLIEGLAPETIIPGHGSVFTDAAGAIARARGRLHSFIADPAKHARHAAKVLLKFRLLEWQRVSMPSCMAWAQSTAYLVQVHERWFAPEPFASWIAALVSELVRAGAAKVEDGALTNA
jgi:glyoxylase-like metal-dependent hydrolase (beta-lactamase superfamily II)